MITNYNYLEAININEKEGIGVPRDHTARSLHHFPAVRGRSHVREVLQDGARRRVGEGNSHLNANNRID